MRASLLEILNSRVVLCGCRTQEKQGCALCIWELPAFPHSQAEAPMDMALNSTVNKSVTLVALRWILLLLPGIPVGRVEFCS